MHILFFLAPLFLCRVHTVSLVKVLLNEGYAFDVVYTSMLKRAIKTAWVVLDELNQQHVPVVTDWHLNERCYGALVGRDKKECVREYGQKQVRAIIAQRSVSVRISPTPHLTFLAVLACSA